MPEEYPTQCSTCKFWNRLRYAEWQGQTIPIGQCQRRAPIHSFWLTSLADGIEEQHRFPITKGEDVCGEYHAAQWTVEPAESCLKNT